MDCEEHLGGICDELNSIRKAFVTSKIDRRTYLAGCALQGILSNGNSDASFALDIADAMIAELDKPKAG